METGTNHSYSDEVEINFGEILMMIWHYIWMIGICAVLAAGVGFCVSRFAIEPKYQSTTQVYVINKQANDSTLTYTDLQMGTQLTKDYTQIIKSRNVLEKVIANLGLKDNYVSLSERINVSTPTDGRILAIRVTDTNAVLAQQIADEVREVASKHIMKVMDTEAMNVVDEANLPVNPVSPSVAKWTITGFLAGAFLCMIVLIVRFLLDDTIKTSEDVEKYLGISTLAMIPLMDEKEAEKEKLRQDKLIRSNKKADQADDSEADFPDDEQQADRSGDKVQTDLPADGTSTKKADEAAGVAGVQKNDRSAGRCKNSKTSQKQTKGGKE